jgi:hypothetical protein
MNLKNAMISIILAASMGAAGCAMRSLEQRHETADQIAESAGMAGRVIPSRFFNLSVWEKIKQPGDEINIYIEGDGLAWLNKHTKSLNPTPVNPLMLRLAALDDADNVIYMARPCQYSGWNGSGACPDMYWTDGRTAPEVIKSYNTALDKIKFASHTQGFNLIGYSGGAAVAALVAAARTDVLSLRTVAGNTDYAAFSAIHNVSPLGTSLDPLGVAPKIAYIPQRHFVGTDDKVIPEEIFNNWKQASGNDACVRLTIVPGATHESGWVEQWKTLLEAPLSCEEEY